MLLLALVACSAAASDEVKSPTAARQLAGTPSIQITMSPAPAEDRTPIGVPPQTQDQTLQSYRALLDSLGTYPGATLLRESVTADGRLNREYGTAEDIKTAPTAATIFYRKQLKALGWETLEEHAAVSAYAKGPISFLIARGAATPLDTLPGETTIMTAKPAFVPSFYFLIQVGVRP